MYAVLGNRSVTEDVLSTTMCIIEQTLNARPLTPVSSDVVDLEALTPNHFLLGNKNFCLPYLPNGFVHFVQHLYLATIISTQSSFMKSNYNSNSNYLDNQQNNTTT